MIQDVDRPAPESSARRHHEVTFALLALAAASNALLALDRTGRWEIYPAALLLGTGIGLAFAAMVNHDIDTWARLRPISRSA